MNYIYKINGSLAELISQTASVDKTVIQDSYPAREQREDCHAVLSYSDELRVHWEYIPFTASEKRERAYKTEKLIIWNENSFTVDEANSMWEKYEAEGSDIAKELTELIAEAKADIRRRFPDENITE